MTPRTLASTASAQDTVLRLALGMWAADPASPITDAQRLWVVTRLQTTAALTPLERAKIQGPLLAWVTASRPTILAIVARQFRIEEAEMAVMPLRSPAQDIVDGLQKAAERQP
jgi:hypothetical protein